MRRIALAFFALVLSLPLTGGAAPGDPPAIHTISCRVISGRPYTYRADLIALSVRFRNDSAYPLRSIVWRANYRGQPVDFIDDGEFSPGVLIDNNVAFETGSAHVNVGGLLANILVPRANANEIATSVTLPPYVGTADPENCTIVRAIRDDGTLWVDPGIAQFADRFVLPTPEPAPQATPPVSGDPISILPCSLYIDRGAGIKIRFRNDDPARTAARIVFRAAYESGGLDFTDNGSFAPGAIVTHTLRRSLPPQLDGVLYNDISDPRLCSVVSVQYADGSTWTNDRVPATPPALPTPVPSAMPFVPQGMRWNGMHGTPTPFPVASVTPSP